MKEKPNKEEERKAKNISNYRVSPSTTKDIRNVIATDFLVHG
jgi:hypothetical protein